MITPKLSCDKQHSKYIVAEREFYLNQKNKIIGTRLICLKCGKNKLIKD